MTAPRLLVIAAVLRGATALLKDGITCSGIKGIYRDNACCDATADKEVSIFAPIETGPMLVGAQQGTSKAKIQLAYATWAPYVYIDESLEPTGFGVEFVKLMQNSAAPECSKLDIEMVQDHWDRMWTDDYTGATPSADKPALGDGINFGAYHGGMTYTHLKGTRPRMVEFSWAITKPSAQAAGLLVKLDANGKPLVDPLTTDLTGEIIVDVTNYAPTTDTLVTVANSCTGTKFTNPTFFNPTTEGNKAAMEAFKGNATYNLMYVYADQARDCADFAGDCEGWEGLGTQFAYLHTGLAAGLNGTTISLGKKNAGVTELINPCIQAVMETAEYKALCLAPLKPPTDTTTNMANCFPNSHWTQTELDTYAQHASFLTHTERTDSLTCANGYCTCAERKA